MQALLQRLIPPPEQGGRQVHRDLKHLEPGQSKLRLEGEAPRGPLRRAPDCAEHDQKDDNDLEPQDLRRGHARPLETTGAISAAGTSQFNPKM
jgi:hypothetical protein